MRNRGRGRGHSSTARGRGQSSSLHRTQKNSSPAAKTPAILLTAADQTTIPLLPRSPVRTRASGKKVQQSESTSGKPKQPSGDDGPGPSSNNSGITIPTKNSFGMLSDNDDDDESARTLEDNNLAAEAKKAKMLACSLPRVRDRPPMIHVVDTLSSTIDDLLLPSNVQYFIKVTKVAVQVLACGQADYAKALDIFKANNVKYFTYDRRDQKTVKVVLQGLAEMDISEVTMELKELDILPREVKVLSKKTTATGTHVLYLLYFDKGTVKIQDLRLEKCLSGYLVKWRFFTKRPTDAAQCHRCQKFGHGSRNCNLSPRCVKCGKDHLTEGCPLPRKAMLKDAGNAEQHKPSVKCANCGGNHTANFRGCTSRKSYIEQQEKKRKPPASSPAKPAAD